MNKLIATWRSLYGYKEDTTPCNDCGILIDTDIHKEELGMCVECSHKYWSHEDEETPEPPTNYGWVTEWEEENKS
jgi:hypothetical protein